MDRLDFLLNGYSPSLKQFLVNGFSCGFRIGFAGERQFFESPNLKSAIEKPDIVISKLNKELEAGRIAGPFAVPPFPKLSLLAFRHSSQEGSLGISSYTSFIIPPRFIC